MTPLQARRFFAATEDAAAAVGRWLGPVPTHGPSGSGAPPPASLKAFVASRRGVVDALVRHEMPASEYVWVADRLLEVHAELGRPLTSPPTPSHVLALEYRGRLDRLAGRGERSTVDALVLALARTLVDRSE